MKLGIIGGSGLDDPSLRGEMDFGHLVLPDQVIDFTRHRAVSFFDHFDPDIGNARHTPMADPFRMPLWPWSRITTAGKPTSP